jgi:hypothetical protein
MEKEKKFKRVPVDVPVSDLTPLNISCTSTKCESDLHCFKPSKTALKRFGHTGCCKECGRELIEWDRIHQNDIHDAAFTFQSMKNELIRHVFWHTRIDVRAISKALSSGKIELRSRARKILKSRIGGLPNAWDGRQTPMTGVDVVSYAQHATATCCRKCLEYWHNIKATDKLSDDQLDFCTDLVMLYVEEKIPNLTDEKIEEPKIKEDVVKS